MYHIFLIKENLEFMNSNICESVSENIGCDTKVVTKDISIRWPDGDGILHIYDDYQPLFTSATWSVTAKLNGKVITCTVPASKPHDQRFIKRWAQFLIRNKKTWLREVGVDVFSEYVKWGGNIEDLNEPLFYLVN